MVVKFGVDNNMFVAFFSTGFGFCVHVRCRTKLSQTLYSPEMVNIENIFIHCGMNEKRDV